MPPIGVPEALELADSATSRTWADLTDLLYRLRFISDTL